jgi:hypothetical protein
MANWTCYTRQHLELLICIAAMLVGFFLVRKQAQLRGIGLFGASCPRCAAPLPMFRRAASISEVLWGGWTCERCGCKVDRYGRERVHLVHFPFTLSVMGTLSIRFRDLTMSFVVSAYFLKCGVSKCALNASAFS